MRKNLDISLGKYRMVCFSVDEDRDTYGVYFFKDGVLTMHQLWGKKPTEEDFLEYMGYLDDLDNKEK